MGVLLIMSIATKITRFAGAAIVCLILSVSTPTSAGVIIGAVGATADQTTRGGGFSLPALSNQSGLSVGYVSGVTDFDSYIATDPTHVTTPAFMWATITSVFSANVTFDLGGNVAVQSFALWNRGNSLMQGVRDFNLRACSDGACSVSSLIGSFQATAFHHLDDNARAEVFSFASTATSFIRLEILNVHGICCITMSEVAFEASNVQEVSAPATMLVFAIGLGGVICARRRSSGSFE